MNINKLKQLLKIESNRHIQKISKEIGVERSKLKYYFETNTYPDNNDEDLICNYLGIKKVELKLKLGNIDSELLELVSKNANFLAESYEKKSVEDNKLNNIHLTFQTKQGRLYQGDCLELLSKMEDESVDLIFADPPFNLNKEYESGYDDLIDEQQYKIWTEKWLVESIRVLKEGGAIFIWNLPKWCIHSANILDKYLNFKHWIAVDIKYSLPIKNRLYPSHYGLLYYTKGQKVNTFNEYRLPLKVCRHCYNDIRDYGGYKKNLNKNGINLGDVWDDISPVRHSKYKNRDSNELPLKLLERIISLASKEGDTVFDPFGGSGTTYIVAEILKRNWIGVELGDTLNIIERFKNIEVQKEQIFEIQNNHNVLFTDKVRKKRKEKGLWLPEDFQKEENEAEQLEIDL